jgi:hypothetical protein
VTEEESRVTWHRFDDEDEALYSPDIEFIETVNNDASSLWVAEDYAFMRTLKNKEVRNRLGIFINFIGRRSFLIIIFKYFKRTPRPLRYL